MVVTAVDVVVFDAISTTVVVVAALFQHRVVVGHGEFGSDPRHLLQKIAEPSTRRKEGRVG